MERLTHPIYQGRNLSQAQEAEIDSLIETAERLIAQRRALITCWCSARIVNGHHCESGHMQPRGAVA